MDQRLQFRATRLPIARRMQWNRDRAVSKRPEVFGFDRNAAGARECHELLSKLVRCNRVQRVDPCRRLGFGPWWSLEQLRHELPRRLRTHRFGSRRRRETHPGNAEGFALGIRQRDDRAVRCATCPDGHSALQRIQRGGSREILQVREFEARRDPARLLPFRRVAPSECVERSPVEALDVSLGATHRTDPVDGAVGFEPCVERAAARAAPAGSEAAKHGRHDLADVREMGRGRDVSQTPEQLRGLARLASGLSIVIEAVAEIGDVPARHDGSRRM